MSFFSTWINHGQKFGGFSCTVLNSAKSWVTQGFQRATLVDITPAYHSITVGFAADMEVSQKSGGTPSHHPF